MQEKSKSMGKKSKPPTPKNVDQSDIDWQSLCERYEAMFGVTPLMRSSMIDDLPRLKKKVSEHEGPINAMTRKFDITLLHFAATNAAFGEEVIEFLSSKYNLDPYESDCEEEIPIMYAFSVKNFAAAEQLLKSMDCDPNLMRYAILGTKKLDDVKAVHEYKPNLFNKLKQSMGEELVELAVQICDLEVVNWLIDQYKLSNCLLMYNLLFNASHNSVHGGEIAQHLVSTMKQILPHVIVNFRSPFYENKSPLDNALLMGNMPVAEALYTCQDDVVRSNINGNNLLHALVQTNNLTGAMFVYKNDWKQINGLDKDGNNILQAATKHADAELFLWLKQEYYSHNQSINDDWNPYHLVPYNNLYGLELLQKAFHRVPLNLVSLPNEDGETPVMLAVKLKNWEVARELYRLGSPLRLDRKEVDANDDVVHFIKKNDIRTVVFMFDGCLDAPNSGGNILIHHAAQFAGREMCRFLFDQDGHQDSACGSSAVHFAALNVEYCHEVLPYLKSLELNLNQRNRGGQAPIHVALKNRNLKAVRTLHDLGADMTVKINEDNLLHFCTRINYPEGAEFVIAHCENQLRELAFGGETALHIAARFADKDFCQLLVSKGIDVKARNKFNLTARECVPLKNAALQKYFQEILTQVDISI